MITPNSQAGQLLLHFQKGKSISRLDALLEIGCFELSARIIDLERHGFKIDKKPITVTARNGKKARIIEYSLAKKPIDTVKV